MWARGCRSARQMLAMCRSINGPVIHQPGGERSLAPHDGESNWKIIVGTFAVTRTATLDRQRHDLARWPGHLLTRGRELNHLLIELLLIELPADRRCRLNRFILKLIHSQSMCSSFVLRRLIRFYCSELLLQDDGRGLRGQIRD
jgi:hypothetical protein